MDHTLISNWNSVIKKEDQVYHLGDFSWGNPWSYIHRLNGSILFVLGNHDKSLTNQYDKNIPAMRKVNIQGVIFTLCHFSLRTWHQSHFNQPHLFGHSHGGLPPFGMSFDVGVDAWNYFPVSLNQVLDKLKTCKNNFNWLKRLSGYDSFDKTATLSELEEEEDNSEQTK